MQLNSLLKIKEYFWTLYCVLGKGYYTPYLSDFDQE